MLSTSRIKAKETEWYSWSKAIDNLSLLVGCESEVTINDTIKPYCKGNGRVLTSMVACNPNYKTCCECPDISMPALNKREAIGSFRNDLKPTGSSYAFGLKGISEVGEDGSVPRGVEIKTCGLPVIPEILYYSYTQIVSTICSFNHEVTPYTGLHFHVLQSGIDNACSYYHFSRHALYNALTLASVALPVLGALGTGKGGKRYTIFCLPYMLNSITTNEMLLKDIVAQPHNGKYIAVTPYLSTLSSKGHLRRPHFEFRYADNILNPSYMLMHAMICSAIVHSTMNVPPDCVYDINSPSLKEAREITVKLFNQGFKGRKAVVTLTKEDMKKIAGLRTVVMEHIEHSLKELDPAGNCKDLFMEASSSEVGDYKSTRNPIQLIETIS